MWFSLPGSYVVFCYFLISSLAHCLPSTSPPLLSRHPSASGAVGGLPLCLWAPWQDRACRDLVNRYRGPDKSLCESEELSEQLAMD